MATNTRVAVGIDFFFQAEDGIRDDLVTRVQTCALPICQRGAGPGLAAAGFSALHQLAPALDLGFHPELFRGCLDPPPGCRSLGVADALDLIEAGEDRKSVV